MQELKELIHFITHKLSKKEKLLLKSVVTKLEYKLYQGIINDSFPTDEEASMALYNKPSTYQAYRVLKKRLIGSISNLILTYVPAKNDNTTYQKAYFRCWRQFASIKMLMGEQYNSSAMYLTHELLKVTERYNYHDLTLELYKIIYHNDVSIQKNKTQKKFVFEKINSLKKIIDLEFDAQTYYTELNSAFARVKKPDTAAIRKLATKYDEELTPYIDVVPSLKFHLYTYLIKYFICHISNDFVTGKVVVLKALHYFESSKLKHKLSIKLFKRYENECDIHLHNLSSAIPSILDSIENEEKGTFSWHRQNEFLFIAYIRNKDYFNAILTCQAVTQNQRFEFQSSPVKTRWRLYEMYAYFLARTLSIDIPTKGFDLKKFIRDTPTFSMDKRAMNIPLIIIQILIDIVNNHEELILDRANALEKYSGRYLVKGENFRSKCFIKMLLQLPLRNYHPIAVKRHTDNYILKLKSEPIEQANQAVEIEIIPYEDLWDLIINFLNNNKKGL